MLPLHERYMPHESPPDGFGGNTVDRLVTPETPSDMTFAIIAQGQGGQYVGMGKRLAEQSLAAAKIWETADRIIGNNFLQVVRDGPKETLNQTNYTQPAVVADALSRVAALREIGFEKNPGTLTGQSLGFITAVSLSGAIPDRDIFKLIKARGDASRIANDAIPSSMVALKDLDPNLVEDAKRRFNLELCLRNTPFQQVYGGLREDIARAAEWLSGVIGEGAGKKVRQLDIGGAFHSKFMTPAVNKFREAVLQADIRDPQHGRLIGITVPHFITTADEVREELIRQLTEPVDWKGVLETMSANGITEIVELGNLPTLINMHGQMFEGAKSQIEFLLDNSDAPPLVIAHRWQAAA